MTRLYAVCGLLLAIATFPLAAVAERAAADDALAPGDLDVRWHSIDGGSATSAGGPYTLAGSVGQADADRLHPARGGDYVLSSGFWSARAGSVAPSGVMFSDGFESLR